MANNNRIRRNNKGGFGRFAVGLLWMYFLIFAVLIGLYAFSGNGTFNTTSREESWTKFSNIVANGGVKNIVVYTNKHQAHAYLNDERAKAIFGSEYKANTGAQYEVYANIPSNDRFDDAYQTWLHSPKYNGKLDVSYKESSDYSAWLWTFGPIVLLVVLWYFLMKRFSGGGAGGGVFGVGRSRAKLYNKDNTGDKRITFADVAGLHKEKAEISEVVEFLKNPKRYTDLGGSIPKGILLVGPPGTGKTLLAKAVAGEADVPFFSMSGSDFVEMFVGVGASRVRDVFHQAKEKSPCIVFIDEIDAIGRARSRKFDFASNDERENTLNQLLTEMDGFGSNSGIIVLAATNRADVLDKALLRAGRFDRQIYVGIPGLQDRVEIFKVHLKDVKVDGSVDFDKLARLTSGLSGADIANVCNEAALLAARHKKAAVQQPDFIEAIDRVTRTLDKPTRMTKPVTFADVAGMEKPKKEISEVVDFLRDPERYTRLGGKIPHGVLLVGPPGSGKTLLAKAVAGEANVPFFSTSGAEFQGEFIGSGVSRVRELFQQAKEKAPSIIFIDELDAVGNSRNLGNGEREITLNQLLAEMDGYDSKSGVIVIGATNRVNMIDKALLRPGRFDRKVYVGFPEQEDRVQIFELYTKQLALADDVDIERLARKASGLSGAEIANVCNEAAINAAGRDGSTGVTQDDFLKAIEHLRKGVDYDTKFANNIDFSDIAGVKKPKSKIMQIVDILRRPDYYRSIGARIPRGVLLVGPSGTGKTMLAKAVANEADVPFVLASGPELAWNTGIESMKTLFHEAKEKSPCVLFIDEIEGIAAKNSDPADKRRNPMLSQLLVEMDAFGDDNGVIVMAACNNQDSLDKALLRPGRFDRHIYVGMPSKDDRTDIFKLYLKKVKLGDTVNIDEIANITSGFSGADISKVCNDAALAAAMAGHEVVEQDDLKKAVADLRKGVEGKQTAIGTIKFSDVAGMDEAKHEVTEIVDFLKNPAKYSKLGGKVPRGALLVGPPGTGKTMLARAVAGEANVPFFSRTGSDFVEVWVGLGASRVRELFNEAREKAPCVVFIDEIDAIGRARSTGAYGGNSEQESSLNQLLTEMDGIDGDTGVIVLAATNRADILDKALLRPGRFDRQIHVELPTLRDRKAIFKVHLRNIPVDGDVDVELLARETPGFSGAEIANACNEAAIVAARNNHAAVNKADFGEAIDKLTLGLENKSRILTKQDRYETAVHEAGHATASWHLQFTDPLVKISIIPRGQALGVNMHLPEERVGKTKQMFLDEICSFLAGRAAEELFLGTIGTGALNDMQQATRIAHSMVVYYGMSDKLPNVSYYDPQRESKSMYSEARAQVIDGEIQDIINEQYQRAKDILTKYADGHHKLVDELMDKEIVYAKDVEAIFGPRPWKSRSQEIAEIEEASKS